MTYLIYTLTGGICIYFSSIHLLPNKMTNVRKLCIFMYAFGSLFLFNRIYGQASTYITFVGILLLIFIFAKEPYFNMSCYLFGYLYTIAFNYLFMWVAGFLLQMDMQDLLTHNRLNIIFSITYSVYCGITTKLLGWYIHKKLNISQYLTNSHLLKAIFIDLFILVFFYIFNFSYGEYLGYNYGVIALNGIIFLLLFGITVYLMYSIYKATMGEQAYKHRMAQFENLRHYTERLENSYGIMRKFKHDYMNILSTMSGYMEENNMDGLMKYYGDQVLPISHAFAESDTKLGALSNVKNTALKSLLSSKFIYSMEIGIKAEIELLEPIETLPMDSLDLSRVIGIFLDNAIEAATETKEKQLAFCMFYKEQDLYIIIRNSSPELDHPISELRNQGISSKGVNRGVGLYNVEVILNHYENVIWNTTYENPYFTQEIILRKNNL